MRVWKGFCLGIFLLEVSFLTGCASIVGGTHNDVSINSYPPKARVLVRDQNGQTVAKGMTPAKVSLKRGNGLLRKTPTYTAIIEKPGYQPAQVRIDPKLNPWIVGNLVLGGPFGVMADSVTGAMWRHSPNKIEQKLQPYQQEYYGMT